MRSENAPPPDKGAFTYEYVPAQLHLGFDDNDEEKKATSCRGQRPEAINIVVPLETEVGFLVLQGYETSA